MLKFCITILSLMLSLSNNGFGQDKSYRYELGFKSENDAYLGFGQDRYYTNGLFINFRSALKPKSTSDTSQVAKSILGITVGQYMFNAQTGAVPDETYVDRPFAAYLFAEAYYQWIKKTEHSKRLSVQVGTIGPDALGEEAQNFIHNTFGFYPINGWQFQAKSELGFNVIYNQLSLIHRSKDEKTDFSFPVEARLGSTFSGLKLGMMLRSGTLNPLYQSVASESNVSVSSYLNVKPKEFYFYTHPFANLIIYDATIKGGLFNFEKGFSMDSYPIVLGNEAGLAYATKRWTVDFSVIIKTKDAKKMVNGTHQFASFDLLYRF